MNDITVQALKQRAERYRARAASGYLVTTFEARLRLGGKLNPAGLLLLDGMGGGGFVYHPSYEAEVNIPLDPAGLPMDGDGRFPSDRYGDSLPPFFREKLLQNSFADQVFNSLFDGADQGERVAACIQLRGGHFGAIELAPITGSTQARIGISSVAKLAEAVQALSQFAQEQVVVSTRSGNKTEALAAAVSRLVDRLDEPARRAVTTFGGVRPKLEYHAVNDDGRVSQFLVKPTLPTDQYDAARVEHAINEIAKAGNIQSAETTYVELGNGERVLLSKRFDQYGSRVEGENYVTGSHYNRVSFRTLLESTPNLRALNENDLTYRHLAELVRRYSDNGEADVVELYRRAVLSVGVNAADNNLSNSELLCSPDGRWTLAPSYDVVPQPPGTDFAISVTNKHRGNPRLPLSKDMLLDIADECGLSHEVALGAARPVLDAMADADLTLKSVGVSSADQQLLRSWIRRDEISSTIASLPENLANANDARSEAGVSTTDAPVRGTVGPSR